MTDFKGKMSAKETVLDGQVIFLSLLSFLEIIFFADCAENELNDLPLKPLFTELALASEVKSKKSNK